MVSLYSCVKLIPYDIVQPHHADSEYRWPVDKAGFSQLLYLLMMDEVKSWAPADLSSNLSMANL